MQRLAVPLILAALACTPAPQPVAQSAAVDGKPQAPVQVSVAFAPGRADLTLAFAAAASAVQVTAYGAHGLRLAAPVQLRDQRFAAGEQARLPVPLPPEGAGELVVTVEGLFSGRQQSRTAAFHVGGALQKAGRAPLPVGPDGRPMVVLPAQHRAPEKN